MPCYRDPYRRARQYVGWVVWYGERYHVYQYQCRCGRPNKGRYTQEEV